MNEDEIKKILKDSASNYEIKTSSSDILKAYELKNKEKKEKKSFFKTPLFKIGTPVLTFSLAAVLVGILVPNILKDNTSTSTTLVPPPVIVSPSHSKVNQTAFSLYSGMNLIASETAKNLAKPLKNYLKAQEFDEDDEDDEESKDPVPYEFKDVVNLFDPNVDTIKTLFESSTIMETKLSEGEFKGLYQTYPYKLETSDLVLYTNISLDEEDELESETTYKGEIIIDEFTSYLVLMNVEKEIDEDDASEEVEIEMEIKYSENSYLKIEQEVELDERSYVYLDIKDNKIISKRKLSFEDEKDEQTECELEVKTDQYYFEFIDIVPTYNGLSLVYNSELEDGIDMTMEEENNTRTYRNEKREIIIL